MSSEFRPRMLQTPPPDVTDASLARRISHLQALHRIGVAMASSMNPMEIGQVMLDEVVGMTQAVCATFYFRDQQTQHLIPKIFHGWGENAPEPLDLLHSDDLAVEAALTGLPRQHGSHAPLECAANEKPAGRAAGLSAGLAGQAHCRLCVPLTTGDEVLGVIDLRMNTCTRIEPDMEEMLATLASQAALILRNASTHSELEQHYREISLLYEIQQEISSTVDYQKVLTLIVERTKRLLSAAECTIRLVENVPDRGRYIRIAATTGRLFIGPDSLPFDQATIDKQVFGGDTVYMEDVRNDPRFPDRADAVRAGVVSLICVPLVARRRTMGSIRVYTAERREFSVSDRKLLLAMAGQAATALEHAKLYKQVEQKNRELEARNDELRRTQVELVKREKLAALGEMAATVAHEIRNPLTSVRGFAQRISRKYGALGDGRLTEYTGIIMQEVDRLNKFIKDVLDFARRAKPTFECTDINRLVAEALNLVHDEFQEHEIAVLPDFDMELPQTVLDQALVKQALLNLFQNSRQAMGRGGILTVRTGKAGNFLRIRVTDSGHGISRELMHKIWTPFYSSKTQGTGLGLSLVQRIVDDHRGRVTLRSRPGKGTIVNLYFPVVDNEENYLRPR